MAIGTANAGTASRHHLVAQWIVIVLGGSGLIAFIKTLLISAFPIIYNSTKVPILLMRDGNLQKNNHQEY